MFLVLFQPEFIYKHKSSIVYPEKTTIVAIIHHYIVLSTIIAFVDICQLTENS